MAKKTDTAKVTSSDDLLKEIVTKQQDLVEAKRSLAAGDLLNPRVITTTRREIARLKTKARQLEIETKEAN